MKYRVIKQNKKTTQIEIETEMLEILQEILKKINKEKPKQKRCRKNITLFKRKVVPFFMNQFRKHLDNDNSQQHKEILQSLVDLKDKKQSKQKKYELGDLVNIFKSSDPNLINVQKSWIQFLQEHAWQAANDHPKLSQKSKEQYQSEIEPLIDQISQKQPYKLYLSREQKINNQGQQENQSIDQECSSQQTWNPYADFIYTNYDNFSQFIA